MAWDISANLPEITFAGGTPGIAATLPELTYANAISASYGNLRNSYLPELRFGGAFGGEVSFEGELADLRVSMVAGSAVNADFAAIGFSGEVKKEIWYDLDGTLPELSYSGQTGWPVSGTLAAVSFAGAAVLENRWNFSASLPQLQYSADQTFVYSSPLVGTMSPLAYSGEIKQEQLFSSALNLPALLGAFEMSAREGGTLDDKFAALEFSGDIIGNPYYDITGILAQLNIWSRFEPESTDEPLVTDSDGVIRHRRWN